MAARGSDFIEFTTGKLVAGVAVMLATSVKLEGREILVFANFWKEWPDGPWRKFADADRTLPPA